MEPGTGCIVGRSGRGIGKSPFAHECNRMVNSQCTKDYKYQHCDWHENEDTAPFIACHGMRFLVIPAVRVRRCDKDRPTRCGWL